MPGLAGLHVRKKTLRNGRWFEDDLVKGIPIGVWRGLGDPELPISKLKIIRIWSVLSQLCPRADRENVTGPKGSQRRRF